jgi:GNAT superfamily N-acetyltransferase
MSQGFKCSIESISKAFEDEINRKDSGYNKSKNKWDYTINSKLIPEKDIFQFHISVYDTDEDNIDNLVAEIRCIKSPFIANVPISKDDIYISWFGVQPDYRSERIGKLLLCFAVCLLNTISDSPAIYLKANDNAFNNEKLKQKFINEPELIQEEINKPRNQTKLKLMKYYSQFGFESNPELFDPESGEDIIDPMIMSTDIDTIFHRCSSI